jgi:hypothetical protein
MEAQRKAGRFDRTLWAGGAAGAAVMWAVLVAVHPAYFTDVADTGATGLWMVVHYGQLILAPVVAVSLLHLLRHLDGIAVTLARVGVVCWLAWFSAFDAIAGIASGVLVDIGATDAALGLFEHGIVGGAGSALGFAGQGAWLLIAIPAGLALRAAGSSRATYIAMFASALIVFHAGPAVLGFAALGVAFWAARPTPTPQRPERSSDLATDTVI